jgi:PTH2 family peptidyl-tRNA hydrolase
VKQAIVVRKDLGMRTGKLATQVAHASVGAYRAWQRDNPLSFDEWSDQGQKKIVLRADSEEILTVLEGAAVKVDMPHYLVRDHGRTQVDPGTLTALALGPAEAEDVDRLTSTLQLL